MVGPKIIVKIFPTLAKSNTYDTLKKSEKNSCVSIPAKPYKQLSSPIVLAIARGTS